MHGCIRQGAARAYMYPTAVQRAPRPALPPACVSRQARKAKEAAVVAKAQIAQGRIRAAHAKLTAGAARELDTKKEEAPPATKGPRKVINYDELSVAENHRGKANGPCHPLARGPSWSNAMRHSHRRSCWCHVCLWIITIG